MAHASRKTVTGRPQGANASPGEILTPTLPCEKDLTVEEIILTPPDNLESQVHDVQDSGGASPHRSPKAAQPRFVERSIDTIHVDPRYGFSLWEAGAFYRFIPRLDLLTEEGVRRVCSALRIRVSMIDGKCFAFGGLLSYALAFHSLSIKREITVELYEQVSAQDVFDAALIDQFILLALMQTNEQIDSPLLQMLVNVQKQRPEIFLQGKTKLIESFGRSPRNFRAKKSAKKPIRGEEDAA